MRTRIDLQPLKTIAAVAKQDLELHGNVGNNKTVSVFVIVYANTGTGPVTLALETSPLRSPDNDSFWKSIATVTITTAAVGVFVPSGTNAFMGLGEKLRWNITSFGATSLTFEVVLFATDN